MDYSTVNVQLVIAICVKKGETIMTDLYRKDLSKNKRKMLVKYISKKIDNIFSLS